jgi:hypothetical protein
VPQALTHCRSSENPVAPVVLASVQARATVVLALSVDLRLVGTASAAPITTTADVFEAPERLLPAKAYTR